MTTDDELSANIAAQQTKPRRLNRAAFIANLPQIESAIMSGELLITVWEKLRAGQKIAFGYDSFRRFARQFVSKTALARVEPRRRKTKPPPTAQHASTAPAERGFKLHRAKPEELF